MATFLHAVGQATKNRKCNSGFLETRAWQAPEEWRLTTCLKGMISTTTSTSLVALSFSVLAFWVAHAQWQTCERQIGFHPSCLPFLVNADSTPKSFPGLARSSSFSSFHPRVPHQQPRITRIRVSSVASYHHRYGIMAAQPQALDPRMSDPLRRSLRLVLVTPPDCERSNHTTIATECRDESVDGLRCTLASPTLVPQIPYATYVGRREASAVVVFCTKVARLQKRRTAQKGLAARSRHDVHGVPLDAAAPRHPRTSLLRPS